MIRTSKHQNLQRALEEAIRSGEFRPGDQIPSEVDLAQRWGVSYMTARKAVAEMVAADILERRASKGTFVRRAVHERLTTTTLNIVVVAYETSITKEFILRGVQFARRKGWSTNIIRLTPQQQDPAVRVIRSGEPTIVMIDDIPRGSSLWLAMKAARGKAVSFHINLSAEHVPTVYSDSGRDLSLAVDHLRSYGHEDIAFVVQLSTDAESENKMVGWQRIAVESVDRLSHPVHMLRVDTPLFESPMRMCYDTVKTYLRTSKSVTAFIAKSDELAQATLAACLDAGFAAPDDISIVCMGNWHTMEFTRPSITSVDFNFEGQFEEAAKIIELAMAGEPIDPVLRIVDAFLVERGSVGFANGKKRSR